MKFGGESYLHEMAKRIGKTRSVFVNDLYQREKNQRNRSRSAFTQRRQSEVPRIQSSFSMPMLPHRRRYSETQILPQKEVKENLDCKVSTWLHKSNPDLLEIEGHEDVFQKQHSINSILESDEYSSSEISEPRSVQSEYSESIIEASKDAGLQIEAVPWSKTGVDILLKVESKLIPIDKGLVSYVSLFFKELLQEHASKNDNGKKVVELKNQDFGYVLRALKWIYSCQEDTITDENVALMLLMSEEFEISRLRFNCDEYLQNSRTFNPLIAIQLAKKYNLTEIIDMKCKEISKLKGFEKTKQFKCLDTETQNKILIYSLERYSKALKVFTQFDVYLCPHHGNITKQSSCCFRAATYDTVDDRKYLLKMEDPAQGLINKFEEVFKSDLQNFFAGSSSDENEKFI